MNVLEALRVAVVAGLAVHAAAPVMADEANLENTLIMKLKCGDVKIKLRPDLAANHVARVKKLTRLGFYNGVVFHRVIAGFMAQGGDPTGTGMGGSKLPNLKAEFSDHPFLRGVVGMARSSDPDSANSQFFIMFKAGHFLDGKYTVWGEVVDGMDCVDQLNRGEPPAQPDKIIKMHVQADMK